METENKDWTPTVGKTAWFIEDVGNAHVKQGIVKEITKKNVHLEGIPRTQGGWESNWFAYKVPEKVFPTAEAARASIKVYDLQGNEVVIPRAEPDLNIEADFAAFVSSDPQVASKWLEWCGIDAESVATRGAEFVSHLLDDVKERFPQIAEDRDIYLDETDGRHRDPNFKGAQCDPIPIPPDHTHLLHHFHGICTECGKTIEPDPELDDALTKMAKLAYTIDSPCDPVAQERLRKAQERFKNLDRREGGC